MLQEHIARQLLGAVEDANIIQAEVGFARFRNSIRSILTFCACMAESGAWIMSPPESLTPLFGGNSNWRSRCMVSPEFPDHGSPGALHHFYGDAFRVECPTGSGRMLTLKEAAHEIAARLARIFLPGADGRSAWQPHERYARDPHWRELVLFHEYFHGDTGRGLGASHQTGCTALVLRCLEVSLARAGVEISDSA